jgi:hypothetical protein
MRDFVGAVRSAAALSRRPWGAARTFSAGGVRQDLTVTNSTVVTEPPEALVGTSASVL